MAENVWVIQDGRSILVEFETSAVATAWGWFGNRSSGEGLEFAAAEAEWTNHAWLRGGQMVQAAEAGGPATITGTLAATEASDTVAFVGTVAHTGALSVTEASDTASMAGSIAHTGTMAVTEAADTFAASGTVTGSAATITGDLAVTEAGDAATFTGLINHTGALAATEDGDTASIVGNISSAQVIGGGGYSRHDTYYNLEGVRERQRKNLAIWENEVSLDAEQVLDKIKEADPGHEKVLFEESERVSANIQELVIELKLKELELAAENRLAEIDEVKKARERLQAQIEEIDAVFVMFMMAAHEC